VNYAHEFDVKCAACGAEDSASQCGESVLMGAQVNWLRLPDGWSSVTLVHRNCLGEFEKHLLRCKRCSSRAERKGGLRVRK
jgi:hypothetical protein